MFECERIEFRHPINLEMHWCISCVTRPEGSFNRHPLHSLKWNAQWKESTLIEWKTPWTVFTKSTKTIALAHYGELMNVYPMSSNRKIGFMTQILTWPAQPMLLAETYFRAAFKTLPSSGCVACCIPRSEPGWGPQLTAIAVNDSPLDPYPFERLKTTVEMGFNG